jgi:hypothetical protein
MKSENSRSFGLVCWTTTATLGCFLCLLQLGAIVSLTAGHTGFRFVAPVALVAAICAGVWLTEREQLARRLRSVPLVLAIIVVALSLAVSAFYYDLSLDGQWYHQTGIINIATDWNPLTDPTHGFSKDLQEWVRHYPKGSWYAAAAIYQTTGNIELGKCVTWIALAAMSLAVLTALLESGVQRWPALMLTALIVLNPAVIAS